MISKISRQDGIHSKVTKSSQHCRQEVSGFVYSEARQPVRVAVVVVVMEVVLMVMVVGAITGVCI